jgi:hypothetical protein
MAYKTSLFGALSQKPELLIQLFTQFPAAKKSITA